MKKAKKAGIMLACTLGLTASLLGAGASSASAAQTGVVTLKTNVNLRDDSNPNAHIKRVLKKGSKWKVHAVKNGMYNLGTGNWITTNSKYVSYSGAIPAAQTSAPAKTTTTTTTTPAVSSDKSDALISTAKKYMGLKYVWGGATPSGFDCSGFIYYVMKTNGYNVQRLNVVGFAKQYPVTSNPQVGDLVIFNNTYKPGPSHIGFYLGNGQFIHASTSKGVTISDLSQSYYKQHFSGYRSIH